VGTIVVACEPVTPTETTQPGATLTAEATVTPILAPTARPSPSPAAPLTPTSIPLPTETPVPAIAIPADWRTYGSPFFGLQITAPRDWTDLTTSLRDANVYKGVGPKSLLLASSEDAGQSLLSGAPLDQGAYVLGFISSPDSIDQDPVETLSTIVAQFSDVDAELDNPTAIKINGASGAAIEVFDFVPDFFPLVDPSAKHRLVLLVDSDISTQAIFLMGQAFGGGDSFSDMFTLMEETISLGETEKNILSHLSGGDQASGFLTRDLDDYWTFNGDSGQYVTISLVPIEEGIDLTLTLIEPTGGVMVGVDEGYANDLEVLTDMPLPESGTYLVKVGEFFNENGAYELSLTLSDEPQSGGGGRIELGQEITSEMDENSEHAWVFEGTADKAVTIVLTSLNEQLDVILELHDPLGRELLSLDEGFAGDAEVLTGFELPVTGEYIVIVRGFSGNGGVYGLSVDEGAESTENFYDAGNLTSGDSRRESLREDEAHAWFFDGIVGDEIMIEVAPLESNLDMDIWLLDPDLQQLVVKDDFLAGEPETIEYALAADGKYLVLVQEFFGEPGDYEIILNTSGEDVLEIEGTLTYSQTVAGELGANARVGWAFDGEADEIINVVLAPIEEDRDLVIILLDPAGNPALTVDASLSGLPERLLAYQLGEGGQWTIVVQEFFSEPSSYELTLTKQEPIELEDD
jgi:hypothetical protein